MKELKQYILISPIFGDTVLDASSWDEVLDSLYKIGYKGEARVIERIYHSVCDTPHILNVDLSEKKNV